VGDVARDDLGLERVARDLVVLARQLDGGLHGLGAAAGEEDAVQVAGSEIGDARRELDRARVRVGPVGVEAQLLGLLCPGLDDVGTAVADVDAEQRRETVEIALSVLVVDVTALTADDDRNLVVLVGRHPREMHPQVTPGEFLKRAALGAGCLGACHTISSAMGLAVSYNGSARLLRAQLAGSVRSRGPACPLRPQARMTPRGGLSSRLSACSSTTVARATASLWCS